MKKILQIILLFCFLSVKSIVCAQLHVVKDNLRCTYGLKDTKGKWVMKADYINIIQEDNGYKIFDGSHYAFFSLEGKLILPFEYTYIWQREAILEAIKNNLLGVYSFTGKEILPHAYTNIAPFHYSRIHFFAYKNSNDSIYTTLADTGGIHFQDVPGYVSDFQFYPYAILHKKSGQDHSDIGIIDTTGKMIIPMLYDEISYRNNYFTAKRGRQITILDRNNKVVLDSVSYIGISNASTSSNPEEDIYIIVKNSLYGLMDSKFNTIVPFGTYESIQSPDLFSRLKRISDYQFQVFSNGKTGVIDAHGKVKIPVIYDELDVVYSAGKNEWKTKGWYFLYKSNGKYGVLTDRGEMLTEAEFDLSLAFDKNNYGLNTIYLSKKEELFVLTGTTFKKADFLFKNETISVFEDSLEILFLNYSKPAYEQLVERNMSLGNFFPARYTGSFQLLDKKGQEIHAGKIKRAEAFYIKNDKQKTETYYQQCNAIKITTTSNHIGIIDNLTGKIILDTLYSEMYADIPSNMLWLKSADGWRLFDAFGKQRVSTIFPCDHLPGEDHMSDLNPFQVIQCEEKTGIVNCQFEWIVPPIYKNIAALSEQSFLVVTNSDHFGLVNLHKGLVADTVYTELQPVFGNYHPIFDNDPFRDTLPPFPKQQINFVWLFKNDTQRIIVDNKGHAIFAADSLDPNSGIIDSMLYEAAMKGEYFEDLGQNDYHDYHFIPDGSQNIYPGALRIVADKKLLASIPFQRRLYELLKTPYEENITEYRGNYVPQFPVTTQKTRIPDTIRDCHIQHLGMHHLSLVKTLNRTSGYNIGYYRKYPYSTYSAGQEFDNYIWQSGELRKTELRDIFIYSNTLQEELILAISQRDDIVLDCHSPEGLLKIAGNRFSFSEKGIVLYLMEEDGFPIGNYKQYIEILIPSERLALHKETSWVIDYLAD